MTIDGFQPSEKDPFEGYDPRIATRFYRVVNALGRKLDVSIEGLENVPKKGRGLLVANHAFGFDVVLPLAALSERVGRKVWVLGEHLWWRVPFVRKLASAVGVVDGTPENVDELLANDELVLVLPGGLREAVKPRELRYHLLWGRRYGFIRAAMRAGAPIIPLASVGTDELFNFVGNAYERGARWLGSSSIPVPLPRGILPIPHLVQLRFRIGEPIPCPKNTSPEDFHAVRRLRREVEGALHELIEEELAERCGLALD